MPKGEAKGRIVPVRFTADDLKAMAAAAKTSKQSVSEWIRGKITCHASMSLRLFGFGGLHPLKGTFNGD
jgi:hypothetical protein